MESEWKEYSIDELKAPQKSSIAMGPFGSRIKAENFVSEGIPIIKGGNLHGSYVKDSGFDFLTNEKAEELKTSQAFRRDLVITHRGTIGQVSIIPDTSKYEKYIVSQSQLKVTLNQQLVNPYYVNYFFRSRIGQHRLLANASQVGVPAIAKASTSVKAILVPCPSLKTQNRIVEILNSLDHKIELNRQTNQTLEQMAQALFKSWFVDFDPVIDNALAAGTNVCDFPEALQHRAEKRKQAQQLPDFKPLPDDIRALFPTEFEQSELGFIPKGWESGTIDDVATALSGYAFKGKDFTDEGDAVIKIKNIKSDRSVDVGDVQRVPPEISSAADRFYLNDGDLIMAMTGATVGKFGIVVSENDETLLLNQRVCKLSMKNSESNAFLFTLLSMQGLEESILNAAQGSAQPNISAKEILMTSLIIPPTELISHFNRFMNTSFQKIIALRKQNYELTKLRDTLLPKLISGEITINKEVV